MEHFGSLQVLGHLCRPAPSSLNCPQKSPPPPPRITASTWASFSPPIRPFMFATSKAEHSLYIYIHLYIVLPFNNPPCVPQRQPHYLNERGTCSRWPNERNSNPISKHHAPFRIIIKLNNGLRWRSLVPPYILFAIFAHRHSPQSIPKPTPVT